LEHVDWRKDPDVEFNDLPHMSNVISIEANFDLIDNEMLSRYPKLHNVGMITWDNSVPKFLSQYNCMGVTNGGMETDDVILCQLSHLESLEYFFYKVQDDDLRHLCNLSEVSISVCPHITNKGLRHLSHVDAIDMYSRSLSNEGICHLSFMKNLRILIAKEYDIITNIISTAPQLQHYWVKYHRSDDFYLYDVASVFGKWNEIGYHRYG
jgi:hypothetical protein